MTLSSIDGTIGEAMYRPKEVAIEVRHFHVERLKRPMLICFPHAGGSASYFSPLADVLGAGIEVLAVEYPGHAGRLSEPLVDDLHLLADAICRMGRITGADTPVFLLGHSMGATVAFEVAVRLEAAGRPVGAVLVSSRECPASPTRELMSRLSDSRFKASLAAKGGFHPSLLGEPEFMEMVLPILRNDYRATEQYRHRVGGIIRAPIAAMSGSEDPDLADGAMLKWRDFTRGPFATKSFIGGHFYIDSNRAEVAEYVCDRIKSLSAF